PRAQEACRGGVERPIAHILNRRRNRAARGRLPDEHRRTRGPVPALRSRALTYRRRNGGPRQAAAETAGGAERELHRRSEAHTRSLRAGPARRRCFRRRTRRRLRERSGPCEPLNVWLYGTPYPVGLNCANPQDLPPGNKSRFIALTSGRAYPA